MTGTANVRLGEVLTLDVDPVPVIAGCSYDVAGVYSFGRGLFERGGLEGSETSYKELHRLRAGQIVMSRLKAWEGALALVDERFDGWFLSPEFPTFTLNEAVADRRFVAALVTSEPFWTRLGAESKGIGARRERVHAERLLAQEVRLPPIDAQRRIAARLDRVAKVSAGLSARLEHVNVLAHAAQVSLAAGVGHRGGGWVQTTLGDVLTPSDAQVAVEGDAAYRIAGIYSFGRGLIDRGVISGSETAYKTLTRLKAGNIVVSKLNGWEGAVAVVDDGFQDAHVSGEYPTFVVDRTRLLPGFFRGIARSPAFWDRLNQAVRGSMVRRRRISASDFMLATIRLPPLETQANISRAIDELDRALDKSALSAARVGVLTQAALNREFGTST